MRELLVVCHAEAHSDVDRVIAGQSCRGITTVGRHQADQLARRLLVEHSAGRPVTRLLTSPLPRATETARAVAVLTGAQPAVEEDLRPPDPGSEAEGQPWDAVCRRFGPDPEQPSWPLIDGGERWRGYLARSQACLAGLLDDHPGGRIVVIGHTQTVVAALTLLIGGHSVALGALKVDPHPTGITRLTAASDLGDRVVGVHRWELSSHNDTAHLEHRYAITRTYLI